MGDGGNVKSAMGAHIDLFSHHPSVFCVSYITQATKQLNNASDRTVCGCCVTKTKGDQNKKNPPGCHTCVQAGVSPFRE